MCKTNNLTIEIYKHIKHTPSEQLKLEEVLQTITGGITAWQQ